MLTIAGKSVGSRRPLFADWSIPLPPEWSGDDGDLTLARLIERIVRHELAAFTARHERRRLDRILTPDQIDAGAEAGRISPEGRDHAPPPPDPQAAVDTALQAFEDGLYLVVIDDIEHRDLDAPVRLTPDSRIVFLRLTFLAGG